MGLPRQDALRLLVREDAVREIVDDEEALVPRLPQPSHSQCEQRRLQLATVAEDGLGVGTHRQRLERHGEARRQRPRRVTKLARHHTDQISRDNKHDTSCSCCALTVAEKGCGRPEPCSHSPLAFSLALPCSPRPSSGSGKEPCLAV